MTSPPGVPVDRLRDRVQAFFRQEARAWGLVAGSLRVSYVLNPGGFVNHSFRVSDGRTDLHLKLATSEQARAELRRWHELDAVLQTYKAPPILGWVDLEDAGGLLFPAVPGSPPASSREVVHELTRLLARLWNDDHLASALPRPERTTAADHYFRTYDDRFTQDLRSIREVRPAFVSTTVLDHLEEEARRLGERVRSSAAFQEELATPVHGDPWLENVLWEDATSWHLVDWDDLAIGDPAADLAMLLGPTANELAPLKHLDAVATGLTDGVRERLVLLGRASLLDWAIDPVADWIEADVAAGQQRQVRLEKERVHREALSLYHDMHGGRPCS